MDNNEQTKGSWLGPFIIAVLVVGIAGLCYSIATEVENMPPFERGCAWIALSIWVHALASHRKTS